MKCNKKLIATILTLFILIFAIPLVPAANTLEIVNASEILRSMITFDKNSEFIEFMPVESNAKKFAANITLNFVGMSSFLDYTSAGFDVDESLIEYS